MKICNVCFEELPLSAFGSNRGAKSGLNSRCRPCGAMERREWGKRNVEKVRAKNQRRWAKSREAAARLLVEQGGVCAVCHGPDPVDLDHDHRCCTKGCDKCWRGWLCAPCNRILVAAADSPLLYLAIEYVERNRKVYG